eukprot:CFRG5697T1
MQDIKKRQLAAQQMQEDIARERQKKRERAAQLEHSAQLQKRKKPKINPLFHSNEPLFGRIRGVVDYLRKNQSLNVALEELEKATGYNLAIDNELSAALVENERVACNEDGTFRFSPKYKCGTADELRELLLNVHNEGTGGISVSELKDSNPTVDRLVDELQREEAVILIKNDFNKEVILYRRERIDEIAVDVKFVDLWQSISIKDSVSVDQSLKDAGMATLQTKSSTKPRSMNNSNKKQKEKKIKNFKNAHMLGLGIFDHAVEKKSPSTRR